MLDVPRIACLLGAVVRLLYVGIRELEEVVMKISIVSSLVFSVVSMIAATGVWAQSNFGYYSPQLQADWYGNGTHQYFEGRFDDAIISFSTAISVNPYDPRPYFYRGLAKLSCGRGPGAADDFQLGAFRETYKNGRASSAVNRSLERIQGPCRLEIERYRRDARLAYQMRRNDAGGQFTSGYLRRYGGRKFNCSDHPTRGAVAKLACTRACERTTSGSAWRR